MIRIKKFNLIQDLSDILIELHEKLGSQFLFSKHYDFYAYEIFDISGLLILFLYNNK